jgi:hypothetical protein
MAKKMTVVPTHLYQKLIKQDPDFNDHLKQQKDEILSWSLPPELRARFYQDVVRELATRKAEEDARPLLVTASTDLSTSKLEEGGNEAKAENKKSKLSLPIKKRFKRKSQKVESVSDIEDEHSKVFQTKLAAAAAAAAAARPRAIAKRKSLAHKYKNLGSPPKTRARTNRTQGGGGKKIKWIEFH